MKQRALLWAIGLSFVSAGAACFSGNDNVPHASGGGGSNGKGGSANGGAANGGSTSETSDGGSTSTSDGGNAAGGNGSGGSKKDPCANTFFCDNFESYTVGSAPAGKWKNNQSAGTVTVDTGKHASGSKAVKFVANQTNADNAYRSAMITLSDASVFPVTGNKFFGRMMFFLESAPTGNVHWTFIAGSGKTTNQSPNYDAIYRYGGQTPVMSGGNFVGSGLMANYDTPDSYGNPPTGPSTDCWLHGNDTTEVVPVGKWSCVEWEFDGPNDTMNFWLNGTAIADLTMDHHGQGCVHQTVNNYEWVAPNFSEVDLGWESYQADDERVFWVDDVALGKARLGCPQ